MNIVLVGPLAPYVGGIAKFNQTLGAQLEASGHDVRYLSYKSLYPGRFYPGTGPTSAKDHLSTVKTGFLLTWHSVLLRKEIKKWLAEEKPDLVVLHWWVPVHFWATNRLLTYLKAIGIPAKIVIHNAYPHERFPFAPQLALLALRGASAYVTMADGETTKTRDLLGGREAVCQIPHPLMPPFDFQARPENLLREKYRVPDGAKVLLFLGYVRPYKGLQDLLIVLANLVSQGENIFLLVAGEFWDDLSTYETQVKDLKLDQNVHLIPRFIEEAEISELFAIADLFVVPYLRGTQSGVLKLALGNGLPCVVSSSVADSFIISRTDRCVVYSAGSTEKLQDAIASGLRLKKQPASENEAIVGESWQQFIDVLIKCGAAGS